MASVCSSAGMTYVMRHEQDVCDVRVPEEYAFPVLLIHRVIYAVEFRK